jgi:hypothetical protein
MISNFFKAGIIIPEFKLSINTYNKLASNNNLSLSTFNLSNSYRKNLSPNNLDKFKSDKLANIYRILINLKIRKRHNFYYSFNNLLKNRKISYTKKTRYFKLNKLPMNKFLLKYKKLSPKSKSYENINLFNINKIKTQNLNYSNNNKIKQVDKVILKVINKLKFNKINKKFNPLLLNNTKFFHKSKPKYK